jgi:hypothetical protein
MSKHIITTKMGDKNVQLTLGWDRMLKQYFYNLMDVGAGEVIGSSIAMSDDDLQDVDAILEELKELGVVPPEKMVDEVQIDEVNRDGSRVVRYDAETAIGDDVDPG